MSTTTDKEAVSAGEPPKMHDDGERPKISEEELDDERNLLQQMEWKRRMDELLEERKDREFWGRLKGEFGYTEKQIESMKRDRNERNVAVEDEEPSKDEWTRISRKVVLPETLSTYKLPWEWDKFDSDYLLVKMRISRGFQEELVEHTKLLRPASEKSDRRSTFPVHVWDTATRPSVRAIKWDSSGDEYADKRIDVSSPQMVGPRKVVLHRKDTTTDGQDVQFSWIHKQKETRSFDEFERFVLNVPDMADEEYALVLPLLKKVRRTEQTSPNGKYLEPIVLRACGMELVGRGNLPKERSAVFICFPYYSIEAIKDAKQSRGGASHYIPTLLQNFYHLKSTRQRDLQQVVHKSGLFPKNHIIHVPQLWAIIINSRLMITSAHISLVEEAKQSLSIITSPAANSPSYPSIIRVTAPDQLVFFFPMEQCKTWFALKDKISRYALYKGTLLEFGVQLVTTEGVPINAEDWQTLIKSQKSNILSICIQLLSPEDPSNKASKPKQTPETGVNDAKKVKWKSPLEETRGGSGIGQAPRGEPRSKFGEQKIVTGKENLEELEKPESVRESVNHEQHRQLERNIPPRRTPPHQSPMRVLPAESGTVLVNANDVSVSTKLGSLSSNMFFVPTKPTSSASDGAVEQVKVVNDGSHDVASELTSPAKDQLNPGSSTTIGSSSLGGMSTSRPSSSKESEIKVDVPPVFTWLVGNQPARDDSTKSNVDGAQNGGHPSHMTPEVKKQNATIETSNAEAETIDHVCDHINARLVEAEQEFDHDFYKNAATTSFSNVEKIIMERYGTSIDAFLTTRYVPESGQETSPWETALIQTTKILCGLFNFFLPMTYSSVVADKYWGTVHDLIMMIPKICDRTEMLEMSKRTDWHRMPDSFRLVDLSSPEDADLRGERDLELMSQSIGDCPTCSQSHEYATRSEALEHLFERHFRASPSEQEVIGSQSQWVMDFEQYLTFLYRKSGQNLLGDLLYYLSELAKLVSQIQHGVCENGRFDRDTYRIPSRLVDAFQDLLMMIIIATNALRAAYENREEYIEPDSGFTFLIQDLSAKLMKYAEQARMSTEKAKTQLEWMTFNDDVADVFTYESVGPQLVLALVMHDIQCQDSKSNDVDLIRIYRDYVLNLQFQVNQSPSRRLLQNMSLVSEELEIMEWVFTEQRLVLSDYRDVLDPASVTVTTESRLSMFPIEQDRLNKMIEKVDAHIDRVIDLSKRLDSLANEIRSALEVRQRTQSKAILVCTIITVAFLPISFVAGFFGMRSVDVRSMTDSQPLIWTTLTAVIIAVVLFAAFNENMIRETFDSTYGDGPLLRIRWAGYGSDTTTIIPEQDKKQSESGEHADMPSGPRRGFRKRLVGESGHSYRN